MMEAEYFLLKQEQPRSFHSEMTAIQNGDDICHKRYWFSGAMPDKCYTDVFSTACFILANNGTARKILRCIPIDSELTLKN
ncbi:hypothetical protein NPIL_622761 [Nephila pilipes]|uniref:Uncharacterized protein n=1 Tax=Nephila pilipes TaxID=299642 RepID=A0A8X6PDD2_NEPPI|nr:hypothetical protein NPIL_622761 [Nephila pilipes]